MSNCYIGLMSGTSLDGVDGVLVDFSEPMQVMGSASAEFPAAFKAELLALNTPGDNELHRAALAANQLAALYGRVVGQLLEHAKSLGLTRTDIRAIGAHGQTVRHRPQEFGSADTPGVGYTLQMNNPALLAELSGIDVVADFRTADLAAGGQGAPLVPAFHAALWASPAHATGVLNIGGISNLTLLPAQGPVLGFDCGPGNALMDYWCQHHLGQSFDRDGAWAASGQVQQDLLTRLMSEPYFSRVPPKSTGRDLFHPSWLAQQLQGFESCRPQDVQASLTALTARACAQDLRTHKPDARELLVCGGGALNGELMRMLTAELPGVAVMKTDQRGLPAMQVEAAAFAWLAWAWHRRQAGNLSAVTGAREGRVLGALYPGARVA